MCTTATVFNTHLPKESLLVGGCNWPYVHFLHFQQPGGHSGCLSQSFLEQSSIRQRWLISGFTCQLDRCFSKGLPSLTLTCASAVRSTVLETASPSEIKSLQVSRVTSQNRVLWAWSSCLRSVQVKVTDTSDTAAWNAAASRQDKGPRGSTSAFRLRKSRLRLQIPESTALSHHPRNYKSQRPQFYF